MNAELAAKAEATCTCHILPQSGQVIERHCHTIDRRQDASDARNQDQARASVEQFLLLAGDARIQLEVNRAEGEAFHPWGLCQRTCVPDTQGSLQERQHLCFASKASSDLGDLLRM